MHKQVSGCTVNFGPNFPESPFLESQTRKPLPPPPFGKLQIWDDQSVLRNTPPYFGKLQIWDDQSSLWNTPPPPILENFRFGMTKVHSGIPPPPPESLRMPRVTTCGRLYPTRITTRFDCVHLQSRTGPSSWVHLH